VSANRNIYTLCAGLVEKFVRTTVTHPWATLLIALSMTVTLGYWGIKIPLKTNIEDLFPETTPHVVQAKLTRERIASSTQVMIVVASPDKEANLRFVSDLAGKLSESPLIQSVEFRRDISFFKKNAVLFLSEEELRKLDRKLKKAIRKAVGEEMGPFGGEEEDGPTGAPGATRGGEPTPEEEAELDAGLDEDFGAEAAKPADAAGAKPPDLTREEEAELDADLDEDFGADDGGVGDAKAAAAEVDEDFGPDDDGEEASFEVPTEEEVKKRYGVSSLAEHDVNAEGTLIGMKVFPSFAPAEVTRSRELLKLIDGTVAGLNPASYNPQMEWTMEGDYHKKIEEIDVLTQDLLVSTFSALALILGLISIFFRRPRIVILTFVPLTAGLAWTLGFAYAAMGYLNLVTAFIFGVLSGLGVEYSMHVAERYVEERERGKPPAQAAIDSLVHLSRAMFGSAVMTAFGFLALMIFEFRGFSQFGAIAGVGIPLCLLVVYVFFPPLVVIFNRIVPEKPYAQRLSVDRGTGLFSTPRRAAAVLAGTLVIAAGFLGGLGQVDFEPDMKKVMTPSKETQRARLMKRYHREVSSTSASPIALLTDSLEETRKVQRYLEHNKDSYSRLETISSVFTFVPDGQDGKLKIVEGMRKRLKNKLGALKGKDLDDARKALEYLEPARFEVDDLPEWVRKKFTDRQGHFGTFVILTARGNKANALEVGEITSQLDTIEVDGKGYKTSASYFILKDVYDIVRKEGPLALLLAATGALIMVLLDFRKLWQAAVAFVPVLLGVGCFVGLMGWTRENFTMFNMIILPSIFGTSIDTCTHILHRIREEGPQRIGLIANTTGAATFLGAACNALGFGSLLYATNPGLANIGKLAPVGLLLCWLVCLVLTCSWGYLREARNR
jgi:predicted RND superfamily exporter protein